MVMKKDFQAVITMMTDRNHPINYEYIAIELAKRNPKLFLEITKQSRDVFGIMVKPAWKSSVREKLVQGEKIEAIKEIRSQAGYGLKEAKDIAELVLDLMYPALQSRQCTNSNMSQEQITLAQEIAA